MARTKIQPAQLNNDWWEELGRATLAAPAATLTITSFTARKYLKLILYVKANGGTINARIRYNNDFGANYADRASGNGSADGTAGSGTSGGMAYSLGTGDKFIEAIIINIAGREKMLISHVTEDNTTGAATPLDRGEGVCKWTNTAAQITRIDIITNGTGQFDTSSEVIILGHD